MTAHQPPRAGEGAIRRWEQMYSEIPLEQAPAHFRGMTDAPFLQEYLATVRRLCLPGGRTLETGIGSGYGAIWLSLHGIQAEGIDYSPTIVERAQAVNTVLGGSAGFRRADLFELYDGLSGGPKSEARSPDSSLIPHPSSLRAYSVIHHQGVLEHFHVPQIRAALAQQVALADWVVFSVPSVHYPFEPEFGDERLLTLEAWQHILQPFAVEDLRYYGDPRLSGEEQILCVLRGQPADAALLALMHVPEEPYPFGISAIVHTRNEARHIADCLATLQGWTDEVIVCDMESADGTAQIAQSLGARVLRHPYIQNFDRARNVSAVFAGFRWILYLDADERVPRAIDDQIRQALEPMPREHGAVNVPFRTLFSGRWLRCLWPGYKAPPLYRNSRFFYHARPHQGAEIEGSVATLSLAPDQAFMHLSFESLHQYLEKLNRYTETEAANMRADGCAFDWRQAVRHMVTDLSMYYDRMDARQDGVHGLIWSVLSGFYRFCQYAKLYELRDRTGLLTAEEQSVPGSVEELLEYALEAARSVSAHSLTSQLLNTARDGGQPAAGSRAAGILPAASSPAEATSLNDLSTADARDAIPAVTVPALTADSGSPPHPLTIFFSPRWAGQKQAIQPVDRQTISSYACKQIPPIPPQPAQTRWKEQ